jgi:hypothetical protein
LSIDSLLAERQIDEALTSGEANEAAGVVGAAMLLYQTILRYKKRTALPFHNWHTAHVHNEHADVALSGIMRFLDSEYGDTWLDQPNAKILDQIVWRFVVRQHQTMSYERGFGGSAPLFHVDGSTVVATDTDYAPPVFKISARFQRAGSAFESGAARITHSRVCIRGSPHADESQNEKTQPLGWVLLTVLDVAMCRLTGQLLSNRRN